MKSINSNLTAPVPTKTLPPAPAKSEATKARCYDKAWGYTPAGSTDLRALFERIKGEQKQAANVTAINRKAK